MSARPYLATPARSACPGRGCVTGARLRTAGAPGSGSDPVNIVCCQFTQSRFSISIAIGPPIVSPAAHAGEDVGAIGLDRHAAAAAVAALSAAEIAGDAVEIDGKPGGDAFENDDEGAAVRFASGEKSHHAGLDCIRRICSIAAARTRKARPIRTVGLLQPSSPW